MGKEKLVTIGIIALILLVAGTIILTKNVGIIGKSVEDTSSEKFAKYLGEHSVLYVQTGCIHCKEQEELFGENLKYLTIVDESEMQKFIDAGIEATPTWVINGELYVGKKTIKELKELTNYTE
jgi:glutaredoxin